MYRCQLCNTVVPPNTPKHRVVLERREKNYLFRPKVFVFYRRDRETGRMKERVRDDPGGRGWEIAREVDACPECAQKYQSVVPNTVPTRVAVVTNTAQSASPKLGVDLASGGSLSWSL